MLEDRFQIGDARREVMIFHERQVWYLIVSIPDVCTLTYFVVDDHAYYRA